MEGPEPGAEGREAKRGSRARSALRGAAKGLGAAGAWSALSFLLVRYGFKRSYYLGILLPLGALLFLSLAWLLYLRGDGLARREGARGQRLSPALLWAALELFLLASALYFWAGVGASYFL